MDYQTNFNYETDSFLNPFYYQKLRKEVKNCFHGIAELGPIQKLKKIKNRFKYILTFKTKSVQGLAGVLECKHFQNYPVVFKTSIEIDRLIEHEFSVIEALNDLRKCCPHFVTSFNMIEFPVSRTYIYTASRKNDSDEELTPDMSESDSDYHSGLEDQSEDCEDDEWTIDDVELFMDDQNYLPNNVLFLEYVSNLTFEKLCRYSDKDLINSQVIGVLAALAIGQKFHNFTHYDLHIDNVLMRQCEPEAIFVYSIGDYNFMVPTFGFYPVIIDMGSSYCKDLEGKLMQSTVGIYDNGLQPNTYDPINDLHHFLLSGFYAMEQDCEEFYYISTRFLYFFRHIPVLRKNGWKKLPNEIVRMSIKYINEACKDVKVNYKIIRKDKFETNESREGLKALPVWSDMDRDLIELLSNGIKLPWNNELDKDLLHYITSETISGVNNHTLTEEEMLKEAIKVAFIGFFKQFQKFDDLERFDDPNDLLYMLREIVTHVVQNWDTINSKTSKITSKNLLSTFRRGIIPMFKDMPFGIDWMELILNCKWIISILNVLFYRFTEDHRRIIKEAYEKTPIKTPIDIIKWYKQNSTIRPVYSTSTVLYIWDTNANESKREMLTQYFTHDEIEELNKLTTVKSESIVLKKLKK